MEQMLSYDYSTTFDEATNRQLYNALSKSVMRNINVLWRETDEKQSNKKRAYYMSAEYLIGRSVFSNLLNLGYLDEIETLLKEKGIDIRKFEEIPDSALGNGGLGRLAACYLESAATEDVPLNGYGIRYKYGLFKQLFVNGFQVETVDDWTTCGDPWSVRHDDLTQIVSFADMKVKAVPYDFPVIGYGGKTVNTLRLWQCEPINKLDYIEFNNMHYANALSEKNSAEIISYVLYPNDERIEGKTLRLRQQYFFVSASIKDIIKSYKKKYGQDFSHFGDLRAIQLNDTHPVVAIPELILNLEHEGLTFEEAFEIAHKTFAFTNHTIMGEALEKWDIELFKRILPEVYAVIEEIQKKLNFELSAMRVPDTWNYNILENGRIHMARLAIYVSHMTNGVAAVHTNILKTDVFRNWYAMYPDRFINKTNGITPRRWLKLCNSNLCNLIESKIGNDYITDLSQLKNLAKYAHDPEFIKQFKEVKYKNKKRLAKYIKEHEGIDINPNFCFDIQVKRMHEYKRQLLNALSIIYFYFEIKEGRMPDFKPTAFIFGAKAAPGYYHAKAIMKFINCIADMVNRDPAMKDKMKVVFVTNYNVSYAEYIVSAADISEQISLAGMEASGTGNMKFMLNGTVTLGTMDGANIEIAEEAGVDNEYIFGASVQEVKERRPGYHPWEYYDNDPVIHRVMDTLINGTFNDNGTGMLRSIFDKLRGEDTYMSLYDFKDYVRVKKIANADYGTDEFYSKSIMNLANAGKFSSDRSIMEYAKEIWKVK
ncbi:MAG: glycogen/starch/alpha-glucan phosphorylase [Clostridia bacterium]|nr:glycogen/starch/alpha-glucan phosphorylase [Clostridia bacterium]